MGMVKQEMWLGHVCSPRKGTDAVERIKFIIVLK